MATCELKSGFSVSTVFIMNYEPTFIPHVAIDAKVNSKAEIHGSFFYERIYSIDSEEAYYVDNTIFSGIAGEVRGEAKAKILKNGKKSEQINTVKTINESFVLIEPYVLKGEKIPLFSKETFKKPQ